MAGVKGRSGGARPGAGRKPKAGVGKAQAKPAKAAGPTSKTVRPPADQGTSADPVPAADGAKCAVRRDPLTFLEDVLNLPHAPLKDRIRAAIAAAQYRHTKLHDGGKKDAKADAAKKAASGRFAPKAPPKLVVNNQ